MTDKLDELSLDPDDWSATRALGHRMLDDVFDDLERVRSRPVWQRLPELKRLSPAAWAPGSLTRAAP